jgi:hypothetical protein
MKKNSEKTEKHFEQLLSSEGFKVERIKTKESRTADFIVKDNDGLTYIIEVKTKIDDGSFEAELKEKGVAVTSEKHESKSTLRAIFRNKTKQLEDTESKEEDLKILWFYTMGRDPETQVAQCEATLMGRVDIVIPGDKEGIEAKSVPCYYFGYAEFYKRKNLDAVVTSTYRQGRLLVNPFSPRVEKIRLSKLASLFRKHNAFIDPTNGEPKDIFVVDDFNLPRKDAKNILEWVKNKYRLDVAFDVHWNVVTSATFVPNRLANK